MMSTLNVVEGNSVQFTKGAVDAILDRCINIDNEKVLKANKAMTDKALRVLACAKRSADMIKEDELEFIGLVGMIDPVRPEVKDAISNCVDAGITTIMITGDHIDTAKAIASELKILKDSDNAISGPELDKLTDDEFANIFKQTKVYARVSPEHKTRIVKA